MLPIRAWLKVSCNKAAGSRAPGRDSALPRKAGNSPEAGKIHVAKATQQSLRPCTHASFSWRGYPSPCPACRAPAGARRTPKQRCVTPHKFYTSPAASQPRAAAVGIPNIYPKPSGFYRHIQQRYLHKPGFWVCPVLLSGSRSAYLPPRHTHPQGYACPPAAACPPQSRLFANHTQDTRGTQRVFANGKPILKLTVKLVRPTRQLGNDKQRA